MQVVHRGYSLPFACKQARRFSRRLRALFSARSRRWTACRPSPSLFTVPGGCPGDRRPKPSHGPGRNGHSVARTLFVCFRSLTGFSGRRAAAGFGHCAKSVQPGTEPWCVEVHRLGPFIDRRIADAAGQGRQDRLRFAQLMSVEPFARCSRAEHRMDASIIRQSRSRFWCRDIPSAAQKSDCQEDRSVPQRSFFGFAFVSRHELDWQAPNAVGQRN